LRTSDTLEQEQACVKAIARESTAQKAIALIEASIKHIQKRSSRQKKRREPNGTIYTFCRAKNQNILTSHYRFKVSVDNKWKTISMVVPKEKLDSVASAIKNNRGASLDENPPKHRLKPLFFRQL
jgi:hypothetical protein